MMASRSNASTTSLSTPPPGDEDLRELYAQVSHSKQGCQQRNSHMAGHIGLARVCRGLSNLCGHSNQRHIAYSGPRF